VNLKEFVLYTLNRNNVILKEALKNSILNDLEATEAHRNALSFESFINSNTALCNG